MDMPPLIVLIFHHDFLLFTGIVVIFKIRNSIDRNYEIIFVFKNKESKLLICDDIETDNKIHAQKYLMN
jgi:hypothetical protein